MGRLFRDEPLALQRLAREIRRLANALSYWFEEAFVHRQRMGIALRDRLFDGEPRTIPGGAGSIESGSMRSTALSDYLLGTLRRSPRQTRNRSE